MTTERQEPILAETGLPQGSTPLVLTKLVREGLPPPLWRRFQDEAREGIEAVSREETTIFSQAAEASPDETDSVPPPLSKGTVTGQEDLPPPMYGAHETAPETAGIPGSRDAALSAQGHPKDIELAKTLERIRNLSFTYSPKPVLAEGTQEKEENSTPESGRTDVQTAQESGSPVDIHSIDMPENTVDGEEHLRDGTSASPAMPDMAFLQEFESLLFSEVERRVAAELEETLTRYLKKAWKEQVSLALTRTLALEGIRLRESLSLELRRVLPEILQRVLHEGLNEAAPLPSDEH